MNLSRFARRAAWLAGVAGAVVATSPSQAAGTPAGTSIDNVATASYDGAAGTQTVTSNKVSLRVDELLGAVVTSNDGGPIAAKNGDTNRALSFQVTNAGNGAEAFNLSSVAAIGADDFDPTVTSIAIDTNSNGVYDPGIDVMYNAGSNDPVLQPDQSVTVFILSTMPANAADGARGSARLIATAATGSGAPGTLFAGAGQGGGDAVVGSTTARAQADGVYVLSSIAVGFVKSSTVADPFGGTRAVPGSIISYQLRADLTGSGNLTNLRLTDAIPSGTTYQPSSLTLNGTTLTDAADSDGGVFASNGIVVTVPTAAAGSNQTVTFKVVIN